MVTSVGGFLNNLLAFVNKSQTRMSAWAFGRLGPHRAPACAWITLHTHTSPILWQEPQQNRTVGTLETCNPWWRRVTGPSLMPQSGPLHPAVSGTRLGIHSLTSVLTAETLIPTLISASLKGQLSTRSTHLPPPPLILLPHLARPDHCHPAAEISPVTAEVHTP